MQLKKTLFSISLKVDVFDTDQKNLWFHYVKKLFLEEDNDTVSWILCEGSFLLICMNLTDISLLIKFYLIQLSCFKQVYKYDSSKFGHLLSVIVNLLFCYESNYRKKDCLELIADTEKLYAKELEEVNVDTSIWKISVVRTEIKFGCSKEIYNYSNNYSSLCKKRFTWNNDRFECSWYQIAIKNSDLQRFEEVKVLCNEFLPLVRGNYVFICFIAEIFARCSKFVDALQIIESLETAVQLPDNHVFNDRINSAKAVINIGLGQYSDALKQLEILQSHFLKTANMKSLMQTEFQIIKVYFHMNNYSRCEKLLESHLSRYCVSDAKFYILVVTKLFLKKRRRSEATIE